MEKHLRAKLYQLRDNTHWEDRSTGIVQCQPSKVRPHMLNERRGAACPSNLLHCPTDGWWHGTDVCVRGGWRGDSGLPHIARGQLPAARFARRGCKDARCVGCVPSPRNVTCAASVLGFHTDCIITWTENKTATDLALSFQNREGCDEIWCAWEQAARASRTVRAACIVRAHAQHCCALIQGQDSSCAKLVRGGVRCACVCGAPVVRLRASRWHRGDPGPPHAADGDEPIGPCEYDAAMDAGALAAAVHMSVPHGGAGRTPRAALCSPTIDRLHDVSELLSMPSLHDACVQSVLQV